MKTYKVKVDTTNALKTTTYGPGQAGLKDGAHYRDCFDGVVYVTTDNPKKIYDEFPMTVEITMVGIGYIL